MFKWCFNIAKSKSFNYFISAIIILNTIILSLDKYPEEDLENYILEKINIVFFGIFFIEMLIKLTGYGFKNYFKRYFNIFDCSIVMISCIDLILQNVI